MSLVLPGFGQLYNGELNKAIWLFLAFAFLSIPGVVLVALYLPDEWMLPALVASVFVTIALWLFGMIDAWRQARKKVDYRPEPWQMSGVYLLVLILCDVLGLPLLTGFVRTHEVESFNIPSRSMEPTVLMGDVLFADKRYNCPGCKQAIRRGDIAIFTYPNDRTMLYIKRVIALPGDKVELRGQEVEINGKSLAAQVGNAGVVVETEDGRSWQVQRGASDQEGPVESLVVPPGQVFVLGDNRGASTDSRKFGTVPMQDVVGRAQQVWFSRGPEGIRWQRFGTLLLP
jgi:signal peptidase I